ncbi:MAG TPA: hypothetical protein VM716_13055 [Gemmatimonadales bacterium]|nr:hypothetical protein [Gemmatimonadales bacterium]
MKITVAETILAAVTNPLQIKNLVRGAWWVVAAAAASGCGGRQHPQEPEPTAPLPTSGIAAQQVSLLPLTLVAAEEALHWDSLFAERRVALAKCDSVIATLLVARVPEVTWVLPEELRRAARRAPGVVPNPDHMGSTILLHGTNREPEMVPDPLRSELRTLSALAGGRYALIPAGLVYRRIVGQSDGVTTQHPTVRPSDRPTAAAELTVVMVDVRTGRVDFRTVARGEGADPWAALTRAVKSLTPGVP